MDPLPAPFTSRIQDTFGDQGTRWLEELPRLLSHFQLTWGLSFQKPPFPLHYHYVIPCQAANGASAVLKLGVPNQELHTEIAALKHYAGKGAAKLLRSDAARGALLLERIKPGTPLADLKDSRQDVHIFTHICPALWKPPPAQHPFPSLEDWGQGFDRLRRVFSGGTGPFPAPLVEKAESLFQELLTDTADPVVLHGDLHHGNILLQEERWVAIDPKGLVGEPAYEIGAFLRNPLHRMVQHQSILELTKERLRIISQQLDLPRDRLAGWGFSQAVLAA